jgi:hypothetical protein
MIENLIREVEDFNSGHVPPRLQQYHSALKA